MDNSTTASVVNGDQPTRPPHTFSVPVNNTSLSEQRVQSYMENINGGGDSVTALGIRGLAPEASVSSRASQVHQELKHNSTLLENNGDNSGA
ncbi:hypothetical protein CHU98_g6201 [Xylaria longipes]|nr:hypothetical protein CHU98_g6201 [Xylaria longipes]